MARLARTAAVALVLAAPLPAAADEIGAAIADAARAWGETDVPRTRAALQQAMERVAQRAAAELAEALPPALPGWIIASSGPDVLAMGVVGGTKVARTYRDKSREVTVEVTADTPIVAQIADIIGNPALSGTTGRVVRIGAQRAVIKADDDIEIFVENRVLVNVGGSAPLKFKLAYAQAIDFPRLARRP